MIHLYVKQHNKTGLKYFGRTYQNPFKYIGSGLYWRRHLKQHGTDITTTHVWSYQKDQIKQCKEFAQQFSELNNIVENKEWANLIVENVDQGYESRIMSTETIEKIRKANLGRKWSLETRQKMELVWANRGPLSNETKAKLRTAQLGKKHSPETIEKLRHNNDGRVLTEKQKTEWQKAKNNPEMETKRLTALRAANMGKPRPEHVKEAVRKANTGKIRSEETKAKLSEAAIIREKKWKEQGIQHPGFKVGHKRTPESIAKGLATKRAKYTQGD